MPVTKKFLPEFLSFAYLINKLLKPQTYFRMYVGKNTCVRGENHYQENVFWHTLWSKLLTNSATTDCTRFVKIGGRERYRPLRDTMNA